MKKKRRLNFKVSLLFIISCLMIILGIFLEALNTSSPKEQPKPKKKKVVEKDTKKEYNASLIMVGDSLIHNTVYNDAKMPDGSYDFKPMLENIKPIVKEYDLAYYNQETVLGGTSLGLSSYPRFNSPQEVGDAFIDTGFNVVSLATNHTMDRGEEGILSSVEYWKNKKDIVTAGSYSSFEERDKPHIFEKNGIKYAFLSYTTWTNGLNTPTGKEYLNNVYSDELAAADIARVKDEADVILVAMHWGTEYSNGINEDQTRIANYLSNLGVDIIIGAHPHVIEPVEYINDTLVIYSLGNFISDQDTNDKLTGLMMSVNIKKIVDKDEKSVIIENPKAELIYTKSQSGRKRDFKVYTYKQLNSTIFPGYMEYYEKYKNIILGKTDKVQIDSLGG